MFDDLCDLLSSDPVELLTRSQLCDRVGALRRLRGALDAYEARVVCAIDGLGDRGLDAAGVLRSEGRVSARTAGRVAATAKRLESLPRTAEALRAGAITFEHAESVAKAAETVTAERADAELVEQAKACPADVFGKRSREWSTKYRADDGTVEYERHRRDRLVTKWVGDDGMAMFLAALDKPTGDAVWKTLEQRAEELWRDDGGRDGNPDEMRTLDQRLADAFVELLTGNHTTKNAGPPHPRHQLNVIFDLNGMTDQTGRPLASLVVDGAPLPKAVLDQICCTAGVTAMLFDGPGRPIWVGRDERSATIAQWRALIARDRGCVGCGADPNRCEAHPHHLLGALGTHRHRQPRASSAAAAITTSTTAATPCEEPTADGTSTHSTDQHPPAATSHGENPGNRSNSPSPREPTRGGADSGMLAADRHDLAGHVAGQVAGEEHHHVGHLPRLGGARTLPDATAGRATPHR
ncbi:MAG: DUF222 domain-containing protein [Acidimicrobiales bacterium]